VFALQQSLFRFEYRYFFGTNSSGDGTTNALSFDVEHLGLAQGEARDYYYNESWQVVEERRKPG